MTAPQHLQSLALVPSEEATGKILADEGKSHEFLARQHGATAQIIGTLEFGFLHVEVQCLLKEGIEFLCRERLILTVEAVG